MLGWCGPEEKNISRKRLRVTLYVSTTKIEGTWTDQAFIETMAVAMRFVINDNPIPDTCVISTACLSVAPVCAEEMTDNTILIAIKLIILAELFFKISYFAADWKALASSTTEEEYTYR